MSALTNLQGQVASGSSGGSASGDPLLSRAQFAAYQTNTGGGHSADLHTLKPYREGDEATMVGSTQDRRTGKPFPSQLVDNGSQDPKLQRNDVLGIRNKMIGAQPESSHPVLGTWKTDSNVAVDLSTAYGNQHDADTATLQRNEDANFNMRDFSERSYEEIAAERGLNGPRPAKMPGQEQEYRRSVQLGRDGVPLAGESRNRAGNGYS